MMEWSNLGILYIKSFSNLGMVPEPLDNCLPPVIVFVSKVRFFLGNHNKVQHWLLMVG